jgi:uncharacterized protein with HEPN domain
MIIGEAARRMSRAIKDRMPQTPWSRIEEIRRIMLRDYFKTDLDLVFETAQKQLPPLKPQIEAILNSLPPDAATT